jgi:DNA-binding MarR family transcriptional regulator
VSQTLKKPLSLELDPVLHQPVRLGIASILAARGETAFGELRDALETTDGNLAAHLKHLEEAGYLAVVKRFENRRPLTTYALGQKGRAAFRSYLAHLEKVIKEAKK